MITEDYVSFEVAKLLKEKGFDEQCTHMYDSQHTSYSTFEQCRQITRNNSDWIHYVGKLNICPIAAPTHQMALKWLRDERNIHIKVHCSGYRNYLVYAQSLITAFPDFCIESATCSFNTYEEAVEAAIKYCLTNLI